jgi:hypothetical protein
MFRFSIRDVLWLTVVVAMAVGWWTNRTRSQATINSYRADYEALQATASRLADEREVLRHKLWQAERIRNATVASPDEK